MQARCASRGQFLPHRTFQPCCCPPDPFGLRLGCALTTVVPVVSRSHDCDMRGATAHFPDRRSSQLVKPIESFALSLSSAGLRGLDKVDTSVPYPYPVSLFTKGHLNWRRGTALCGYGTGPVSLKGLTSGCTGDHGSCAPNWSV